MAEQLLCQNSNTGVVYDITTLAGNLQHSTTLSSQPGKFSFTTQEDPNGIFEISNGSIITYTRDGKGVFYGFAFILGTDATGVYKITAYDQLRYWKNEETMLTENMTADQIFEMLCETTQFNGKVVTPSSFIVPSYFHNKKSIYSIMDQAIMSASVNDKEQYFIRDDFGTILFTNLAQYKTNLILGDRSLLTSYQYESSIDKDSYNKIKIIRDNEETGKRDVWIEQDSNNQKRWGTLQMLEVADKDANESQIRELAANLLTLKNRETKTMKLTALGVQDLVAGTGFLLDIAKLGISQYMWITSATHHYVTDYHTMELEVYI